MPRAGPSAEIPQYAEPSWRSRNYQECHVQRMPWYHKSYGKHGNRSQEEVTAQWRLRVAEEELIAEEEAARKREEQRLRAENEHRRAVERAERLHELAYARHQKEARRQDRADRISSWRTDVVDQRIADIYHHGTLNAEKQERLRRENADRLREEKRKRNEEAEAKRKADEERARQRQLQANAKEDAAILSAMRRAGVVRASKKKVKKKVPPPQTDVYNLVLSYHENGLDNFDGEEEDDGEDDEEIDDAEASAEWRAKLSASRADGVDPMGRGTGLDGTVADEKGKVDTASSAIEGSPSQKTKRAALNLELTRYPHAKVIKGEKLGPLGAAHLATAIMPKRQLGSAHLSPGACPNLRELNLSFNQIRAKGAISLSRALGAGAIPYLVILNLANNYIAGAGCTALAEALEAGGITKVQIINLRQNEISDSAAVKLAHSLFTGHGKALVHLNLSNNVIKSRGAEGLVKAVLAGSHSNLEIINIKGNKLDIAGRKRLGYLSPSNLQY